MFVSFFYFLFLLFTSLLNYPFLRYIVHKVKGKKGVFSFLYSPRTELVVLGLHD